MIATAPVKNGQAQVWQGEGQPIPAKAPKVRLPKKCPLSGKTRNYRVEQNLFGAYPKGTVLPEWVLLRSAGASALGREDEIIDKMVLGGKFSETYDAHTADLRVPTPKAAHDPLPELTKATNDLSAQVKSLQADVISLSADRDSWKAQVGSRDKALGEQSAQIADLNMQLAARDELIASQKAEIVALTDQLDKATRPTGAKK